MSNKRSIDRPFLLAVIVLVIAGAFVFSSASLGLLARDGATFSRVAFSQFVFGVGGGGLIMLILAYCNYRIFRRIAPYFFGITLVATALVYTPLGIEWGGARRWLAIGDFSIQPAEFLKLAAVVFFAALLSRTKGAPTSVRHGLAPFLAILGICGLVLVPQPDTGTFLVIACALLAIFIAAGARFQHVLIAGLLGALCFALLAVSRPYIMDRILSFLDHSRDPLGSGYQIQQSLIAIGAGGWFGRGFGQSVQKFNYLPEPTGDSIFSVFAEEFGFFGSFALIAIFLFFAFRGLRIASRAPDYFGGLLVIGIVILIVSQSFINMASMLGVFPLTGMPLLFISHGGTALIAALAGVGIILSVSRFARAPKK